MTAASADLRSLAANLAHASGEGIQKAAAEVIRDTAEKVQNFAVELAPKKTGALSRSIMITYVSPLEAHIGPTLFYGVFQEFGTASRGEFGGAPYKIRPKRAERLTFQIDGTWISTKEVTHPGIPPHPYMRPALEQAIGPAAGELARKGALLITKGQWA
jgi:HK97 gp10 family phage protein